ncbi:hypothetical protein HYDPIDRAFT_109269 [Hydnomerulius pinastri MD-312]|nr:hypothetical protein HYDPIDRAFT_109269 [Hydnomerulius pinastri MD-312]
MHTETLLTDIIRKADGISALARRHGASKESLVGPINYQPSVDVTLPSPPSLLPSLLALGAPPEIASEVDRVYLMRAAELRTQSQDAIAQACSRIHCAAHSPQNTSSRALEAHMITVFRGVYAKQLAEWAGEIVATMKKRLATKPSPPALQNSQRSPHAFNQEYVPLLEHFFKENPFPSHADKAFLAKKSGMSYRQIHVWFQNKRNRSKKEGKALRKKPMSEGATLPLDTLFLRMERYIIPEQQRTCNSSLSDMKLFESPEINEVQSHHPLSSLAPLHAFPSAYPPSCSYEPFPIKNGFSHLRVAKWPRRPSFRPPVTSTPADMAGFVEDFAQLNVRDGPSSRVPRKGTPSQLGSAAATSSITVVPSTAPLPAFIPTVVATSFYRPTPLPVVPARMPRVHVFKSPSPRARPVTLVPPINGEQQSTSERTQRKVAPLPRRMPRHASLTCRDFTPFSEASSPSSSSRSVSTSSEPAVHDGPFSITSSSAMTPSPHSRATSPSHSRFDYTSTLPELLGDSLFNVTPAQGLGLDFSAIGKSHFSKCAPLHFASFSSSTNFVQT